MTVCRPPPKIGLMFDREVAMYPVPLKERSKSKSVEATQEHATMRRQKFLTERAWEMELLLSFLPVFWGWGRKRDRYMKDQLSRVEECKLSFRHGSIQIPFNFWGISTSLPIDMGSLTP